MKKNFFKSFKSFKLQSFSFKSFFNLPEHFFNQDNKYLIAASVFGFGFFKFQPKIATAGFITIIAIILGFFNNSLIVFFSALLIILSFFLIEKLSQSPFFNNIVIDVAVGQSLALIIFPKHILLMILAFIIFSALTYFKPAYIHNMINSSFKTNTAIIMDDIIIGFISLISTAFLSILF